MCQSEAQAEGSLGTGVPREDKKGGVPREDTVGGCHPEPFLSPRGVRRGVSLGRRPERSEGCLANARQDKREVARQDKKWGLGAKIVKI
jgi:hypothetical protein